MKSERILRNSTSSVKAQNEDNLQRPQKQTAGLRPAGIKLMTGCEGPTQGATSDLPKGQSFCRKPRSSIDAPVK